MKLIKVTALYKEGMELYINPENISAIWYQKDKQGRDIGSVVSMSRDTLYIKEDIVKIIGCQVGI